MSHVLRNGVRGFFVPRHRSAGLPIRPRLVSGESQATTALKQVTPHVVKTRRLKAIHFFKIARLPAPPNDTLIQLCVAATLCTWCNGSG